MSIWIVLKDLLVFARDKKSFITLLLMPLMLIAILGAAFGNLMSEDSASIEKFTLGYVDNDGGEFSTLLQEEVFETSLRDYIELEKMTKKELQTNIREKNIKVGIIIPNNFSSLLEDGEDAKIEIIGGHQADLQRLVLESGLNQFSQIVQGRITIGNIVGQLQGEAEARAQAEIEAGKLALQEAIKEAQAEAQSEAEAEAIAASIQEEQGQEEVTVEIIEMPNFDTVEINQLINERTVKDDRPPISSFQYYAAGMGVMFLLMTVVITVGSMIEEKESQVYNRLLISNLTNRQYLLGKFAGIILLSIIQFSIIILGTIVIFKVNWGTSISAIVLTVFSFTISAAGLGVFIGSWIKKENVFSNIGIIGTQVLAAIGGSMVPIYLFPDWMLLISKILPNALALQMFLEVMAGSNVSDIAKEAFVSIGVGIVLFFIAWLRLSWKGGKQKHA